MKYGNSNRKFHYFCFLTFAFMLNLSLCDSVCDLELLVLELKQDLEDNGILDCLRIIKPPNGVVESIEQKNKRLAAQWDTACSFESSYDWVSVLKKNYGITTLVDEVGEPVDHNQPDQADMCEIVRAAVKAGLLENITSDVTAIPPEALNYIDCPGIPGGVKICAVNAISYYKTDMWTIMLDGMNLQVNNFPQFIKASENVFKEDVPDDPGQPIEKPIIEAIDRLKYPPSDEMQRLIASSKDFTKADKKRPEDPFKRVYVKYSTYKPENIQANIGWTPFASGNVSVESNMDFFVVAYSMVSGYAADSRLAVRLQLDDVSQIATRMIQGYVDYPAITTGFVSQLQLGQHKIVTEYRASKKLNCDMENKPEENITTGLIVIPTGTLKMKKVINPSEIQLYNDNSWTDFPNLSTNIKLKTTSYVLVMYNIAMPGMHSHIVTRVDINTQSIFVSSSYNINFYYSIRKVEVLLATLCTGVYITLLCISSLLMWNIM